MVQIVNVMLEGWDDDGTTSTLCTPLADTPTWVKVQYSTSWVHYNTATAGADCTSVRQLLLDEWFSVLCVCFYLCTRGRASCATRCVMCLAESLLAEMLTPWKMPAWASSSPGVLPAIHPAIHSSSLPHILQFIQSSIPESNQLSSPPANSTKKLPFAKVITGSQRWFNIHLFDVHSKPAQTHINMQSENRGAIFNSGVEPADLRSAKNGHIVITYFTDLKRKHGKQKNGPLLSLLCMWQYFQS